MISPDDYSDRDEPGTLAVAGVCVLALLCLLVLVQGWLLLG